jgi:hypothetical protein
MIGAGGAMLSPALVEAMLGEQQPFAPEKAPSYY